MPGFKAVPASIRAFGAAVGDLAGEAESARQYATQWLGIGYAEARMFATVVEHATAVRDALDDNYRRLKELAEAAGVELARRGAVRGDPGGGEAAAGGGGRGAAPARPAGVISRG